MPSSLPSESKDMFAEPAPTLRAQQNPPNTQQNPFHKAPVKPSPKAAAPYFGLGVFGRASG